MNEYEHIVNAFTKDGDNTNLEVNNLEATCITSTNNKFNLDSDGNLTVRSLTTQEGTTDVSLIYPIGSIYMSVNDTNPGTIFGGTWEQIKDKFLLACGDNYTNGETGGESEVTLTESEIPAHRHRNKVKVMYYSHTHNHTGGNWGDDVYLQEASSTGCDYTGNTFATMTATGGGQPHNNMPPYLAVYIWKRTA